MLLSSLLYLANIAKIFKASEIWHNNKFGDNYNHSSDEPLLLGEVDEWTGIPLFEATSAGIVL